MFGKRAPRNETHTVEWAALLQDSLPTGCAQAIEFPVGMALPTHAAPPEREEWSARAPPRFKKKQKKNERPAAEKSHLEHNSDVYCKLFLLAVGHTVSNAPDLFQPPKLSGTGPG